MPAVCPGDTGLPTGENYGIDASYTLIDIATNKAVMDGSSFARVSYDMPGSYQRYARTLLLEAMVAVPLLTIAIPRWGILGAAYASAALMILS